MATVGTKPCGREPVSANARSKTAFWRQRSLEGNLGKRCDRAILVGRSAQKCLKKDLRQ